MSADAYTFDQAAFIAAGPPEDCRRCGRDACAGDCGPKVAGRPRAVQQPGPRFRSAAEWMADPRPPTVVECMVAAGCITVLVAESGSGKTFLLLDVASAIVAGWPWRGRVTQRGTVAYATWEGDALGLRLRALSEAGRETAGIELLSLSQPLSARPGRDGAEGFAQGEVILAAALRDLAQRLEAEGRPPLVLLVLDTLRASMAGSEDSSEDTSAYLRAVRRILAPYPGVGCIVAHHSGWQDSAETRRKRERGSSAIRGNVDATIYLEAGDYDDVQHVARLTLSTLKIRDEERPAPLRLIRRRVELLDRDDRGRIVTSCVIEDDPTTPADREAEERATEQAEIAAVERRVLDLIGSRPVTSQAQIREVLGVRSELVATALSKLLAAGRVTRSGQRSPYRLGASE